MSEEFEELEQIPWAALAARTPDPRLRLALAAVSLCSIVVLLLVVGKVMLSGKGDPPDAPATPAEQLAAESSPVPASAESSAAAPQLEPSEPLGAYSEADLMAISPDAEERLAGMWAEWFVRDYLTGDGDDVVGFGMPDVPAADLPAGSAPVFVEWVEAFAVMSPAPGSYRVEVAYRVLVETDNGFVRRPAAALAAELAIGVDGAVRLLDPPEPSLLPERSIAPLPVLAEELPPNVVAGIGDLPNGSSAVGGYQRDGSWHVLVSGEIVPGVERVYRVVVPQK